METTRPYCSFDYDACRDAIIDACRDRAAADDLQSGSIVLPVAPKEIEATPDSDAAKAVVIRAIRAFAKRRGITHDEVRMRPHSGAGVLADAQRGRLNLNMTFLIQA